MANADLTTAAEDRPLSLRKRPDLQIHESFYQKEKSWIVKDPVSLKYHRLQGPEITVLDMLDGSATLRQIQQSLQRKYPTKITRLADLQYLLSSFHRAGLVVADASGQNTQLLRRKRETDKQKRLQRLSNVLAIRFPGFDPEPIVRRLHPRVHWIFDLRFAFLWFVLAVAASTLVLVNLDEFHQRLPGFHQFFSFRNFLWLALIMAVTKITHEFGHGLACKHFGGECHEIGIMLLVLTPALYCDTSDSWVLPNKWHRAFIGAAGMYIEVLLASIATFVWWYTQPGLLNYMSLNVMFVCSVSTVIFNANPLLRYDGYYILADILEIPNLAQKSRLALISLLRVVCLGLRPVSRRQLPSRGHLWFALYSIASVAYRWFVLGFIMWFLYKVFEPYGLEVIGHSIIAVSLVGLVGVPFWKTFKFFRQPGRIDEVKPKRLIATLIVVGILVALVLWLPLPHHVLCPLVVRPDKAERIYVVQPGTLQETFVSHGDQVRAGDPLARLENVELAADVSQLEGELARRDQYLRSLERRRGFDAAAEASIPAARSGLKDVRQQLEKRREDVSQLRLCAHRDGTVIPPPEVAAPTASSEIYLRTWWGRPLERKNLGAFFDVDTLICMIGDPQKMKAVLMIDQSDVELVRPGQSADIMLDEAPGHRLRGTIGEVAQIDLKVPPRELTSSAGGVLLTQPDPSGREKPLFVYYQGSVQLYDTQFPLLNGFRGQAKVNVGPESIARRLLRLVRNVIHFR